MEEIQKISKTIDDAAKKLYSNKILIIISFILIVIVSILVYKQYTQSVQINPNNLESFDSIQSSSPPQIPSRVCEQFSGYYLSDSCLLVVFKRNHGER